MSTSHDIAAPLNALLTGVAQQGERHLGEVQADLRQTTFLLGAAIDKLGKSFIGIHEAMAAQQALLAAHMPAEPAVQAQLAALQADSHRHADAAITALQFEDMTGQLIGRIVGHVDSLRAVLDALGSGAASLDAVRAPTGGTSPADAAETVVSVLTTLNQVLDGQSAAAPSVAKKTVAQTHMDSGDIELF